MSDYDSEVNKGCGCILQVTALFLLIFVVTKFQELSEALLNLLR